MAGYLIRRMFHALLVIWGAVTIMFLLFYILPGNTLDLIGGGEKATSAEVRRNQEVRYGLDKSVPEQYVKYWQGFSHWDLGRSVQDGKSVNGLLKARASNSALWPERAAISISPSEPVKRTANHFCVWPR